MKRSEQERFFRHVDKETSESGCWLWTSTIGHNGYGAFHTATAERAYKIIRAHRYSWSIVNGPIPDGSLVLHRCDVRCCVNPSHLFIGSQKQNIADMIKKGRRPNTAGENSHVAKINTAQAQAIRADKRSQREIGEAYGLSQSAVSQIKSEKLWKHI